MTSPSSGHRQLATGAVGTRGAVDVFDGGFFDAPDDDLAGVGPLSLLGNCAEPRNRIAWSTKIV